jgi:hypothetical protein
MIAVSKDRFVSLNARQLRDEYSELDLFQWAMVEEISKSKSGKLRPSIHFGYSTTSVAALIENRDNFTQISKKHTLSVILWPVMLKLEIWSKSQDKRPLCGQSGRGRLSR